MMKKVVSILLVISSLFLASACFSVKPIEIEQLNHFEIAEFKDNFLTLKATITIHNPNSLKLKITDARFDLKINDKVVGNLEQMETLAISANSEKEYPIVAKFKISNLKNGILSLMELVNKRDPKISLTGSVTGRSFLYKKTFDFTDIKIYN